MEEGKYGICKVCGEEIEEARLEANPAAETCKAHLNS
jgi:RNA polymerase-binding transcription factor DksA